MHAQAVIQGMMLVAMLALAGPVAASNLASDPQGERSHLVGGFWGSLCGDDFPGNRNLDNLDFRGRKFRVNFFAQPGRSSRNQYMGEIRN